MDGQQNIKIHSYSLEIKSQKNPAGADVLDNWLEPATCEQKETLLCLIEFGFVTEHAGVATTLWPIDRIRPVLISAILKFLVVFNQSLQENSETVRSSYSIITPTTAHISNI